MHAVVVSVTIHEGEAATRNLRENIVPQVSQAPGFVAGYWVRLEGANKGRSTVVFESEDAARTVADQIRGQVGDEVTLDSVDIGEVVANA